MNIIATHINYHLVYQRKLWLFANNIQMEHTSDTVYDGKLSHETSYPQRADKYSEIELSVTFNRPIKELKLQIHCFSDCAIK